MVSLEEAQHEEVVAKLEEVEKTLLTGLGENNVIARTNRQLYSQIVALKVAEFDHFENEGTFVVPVVRDRMSDEHQLTVARHLLYDADADNPRWIIEWVSNELNSEEQKVLAALESSFPTIEEEEKEKMTRLMVAGVLLVLVATVSVACGSENGEAEPSGSIVQTTTKPATAEPSIPEGAVTVVNQDAGGSGKYEFAPKKLEFKVGEEVTFALKAETEFHTFSVDELGINVEMDAGETKIFNFTFNKAGKYKLICIPHETLGMVGEIVVE